MKPNPGLQPFFLTNIYYSMTKQLFAKAATIVMIFAASLLSMGSALAQNPAIRGKVVDSSNAGVIGAAVLVPGTTNGVQTDLDGNFEIRVAPGTTLEVSCIGYVTKRVAAAANMVVVLEEDAEMLDETVVIGYGVQKKSDLTGSVASVRGDDLKNRSTTDAAAALQGKASGVHIVKSSGAPGKGAEIRVRGVSSNSNKISPLLIVDGLKVDNIQYLDPDMIESMEVLKDAASAAIYGAAAGNGVVLITTKSGKKGDGRIFYNNQFIYSMLSRKLDIMNAKDYIAFEKANGFMTDKMLEDAKYDGTDVNWSDEIFNPSWSNHHTVGFQGGNERGGLYVAINNVYDDGIVRGKKDVYNRLTFQVNADYKIKDWLSIGTNNSIEKWSTKSVTEGSDNGSFLLSAITSSPLFPARAAEPTDAMIAERDGHGCTLITDPETGMYWMAPRIGETQSGHPFVRRDATDSSNGGFNIRGIAYLNFSPIKGLVFTSRFGYRIAQSQSHSYTAPYYSTATLKDYNYTLSASNNSSFKYQWENFVNYNRTFGKHEIGVMAGMSFEENNKDNLSANATGTNILKGYAENFRYMDFLLDDGVTKKINNAPGRNANMSYFGRLLYTYDSRYSIQANFRADAFDTSKLPAESRWGYFPSVSGYWNISNEPFFRDNVDRNLVSFLKLRASYGVNGNIDVLDNYLYSTSILSNAVYYQFDAVDPAVTLGSIPSGLANPDLRWETSVQFDAAIEGRLFNNRLNFSLGYYDKNTRDWLVPVSPTKEVGLPAFGDLGVATTVTINAGSVNNRGIELELGWRDQIGDFGYSINGNAAWQHNEVTFIDPNVGQLPGYTPQGVEQGTFCDVGHPVWYFLGYKAAGFDNEGNALYYAADGTTTTSPVAADRVDLGSAIPTLTYGLTISLNWKNIDFTVFANGVAGNKAFQTSWRPDRKECNTYSYYWANSWDNPAIDKANAKFPAASKWSSQAFSSSMSTFDASYLKIREIQLGYTLPKNLTQKAKINNLRIFAGLNNFFTFTKYIGLDPEVATTTSRADQAGIDMGNYPTAKSVVFGVNLEF